MTVAPLPARFLAFGFCLLLLQLAGEGRAAEPGSRDLGIRAGGPAVAPSATARPLDKDALSPEWRAAVQSQIERLVKPAKLGTTSAYSYESNVTSRYFASSVATAGDVNADGYSDIIAFANGATSATGAIYLFLGSASGPVLAPGFPIVNQLTGGVVGPAGDLNGDGYADVAIGWPGTTAGSIRVYYGNAAGLNTGAPFNKFFNFEPSYGRIVGPAGDVNGDGYDDLLVAAPFDGPQVFLCSGSVTFTGRVDVYYGSTSGISNPNWILWGCQWGNSGAEMGAAAATAGDVNADGYDDIVIGAPGMNDAFSTPHGEVEIVYGSAGGLPLLSGFSDVGTLAGATRILGPNAFTTFGASVAPAGDINGDGYADVVIGAPYDDTYFTDGGHTYLYGGSASGLNTASTLWEEFGPSTNAHFGLYAAPAGDLNGDGRGDILVGMEGQMAVAQSVGTTMIIGQQYPVSYTSGQSYVTAGDVDGDGFSDVAFGDPYYTNPESAEGRLLIYKGTGDGPAIFPAWEQTTALENPNFGWSVASAGDVNADGFDDVLVGAPTWDNFFTSEQDNGLVLLFFGHATGPSTFYDWYYFGTPGEQVGISVAAAGDVNGDGRGDFIVGAHAPGVGNGAAYVWYGTSGLPALTPNRTLLGASFDGQFGASVAGAGDVNSDGYADVIVGAPMDEIPSIFPPTIPNEGVAYVYLGGSGGLSTTPTWWVGGGQQDAHLGSSVASAGDVNANGFSDVIVGEPDYDMPAGPFYIVDSGRAGIFLGGAGPGLTFQTWIDGLANERLASTVAGAGDVNGDGYSDVILGAPSAPGSLGGEGRAVVYAGSASGINAASSLWSRTGGEAFGGFGSSVSSAGDINDDGLSDVLVGGVFQDAGGAADRGTASVFLGPLPMGANPAWTAYGPSAFANIGHVVANAGDVNGDSWNDLLFGAPGYSQDYFRQGLCRLYLGTQGLGLAQIALAIRYTPVPAIIPPLGLTDPNACQLGRTGRSAAGRTKVKLQWRMAPVVGLVAPTFEGIQPTYTATGAPGAYGSLASLSKALTGLPSAIEYAWQVRSLSRSPYFPTTIWSSPALNARREADAKVPGSLVGVEDGPRGPLTASLAPSWPNPMRTTSSVSFALTRAGQARLDVVDIQGRVVRTLVDGVRPAGPQSATWDGRGHDGAACPAGVYFYRLQAEGRTFSQKVALVP